jgi:sulfite exporter TauE/SafE
MTTPNVIGLRCFYHEFREAACRCPICRRYFCRECVTEHDDRVLCVECLKTIVGGRSARLGGVRRVRRAMLAVAGVLMAWLFFYAIGRTLLLIPSAVHDGTVWESK